MIDYASHILDHCSDPDHPYYFEGQLLLVSGLAYTGTAFVYLAGIISTTPLQGAAYIFITFQIHNLTKPFFSKCFEPFYGDTLTAKAYIFTRWTFSLLSAKLICALFGITVTVTQIIWISIGFFIAYRIAKIIVEKFRQSQGAPILGKIPMRT